MYAFLDSPSKLLYPPEAHLQKKQPARGMPSRAGASTPDAYNPEEDWGLGLSARAAPAAYSLGSHGLAALLAPAHRSLAG